MPHEDDILFHLLKKNANHKIVVEHCDEMLEYENEIQGQQEDIKQRYIFKGINEEEVAESEQQFEEEYAKTKERGELIQYDIVEIARVECEEDEGGNAKFVEEQTRKRHQSVLYVLEQIYEVERKGHSNVLNIFSKMYVEEERNKGFVTLMQREIHLHLSDANNMFQQERKLDKGIDKGRYTKRERKTINCTNGLIVKYSEGKRRRILQHKVWKPREVKAAIKDDSSRTSE